MCWLTDLLGLPRKERNRIQELISFRYNVLWIQKLTFRKRYQHIWKIQSTIRRLSTTFPAEVFYVHLLKSSKWRAKTNRCKGHNHTYQYWLWTKFTVKWNKLKNVTNFFFFLYQLVWPIFDFESVRDFPLCELVWSIFDFESLRIFASLFNF